jgi:UDP-glucuronate 4-epimerase
MKVLVTGVAGFIGMHMAERLAEEDFDVVGLDNINSYYDTELKYKRLAQLGIERENILYNRKVEGIKNIQFIELDLTDAGNLINLFSKEKFDIVINLAAQAGVRYSITNPKDYINSNIIGFFNLLEVCKEFKPKSLIYASSSSVYGNSNKFPLLETDNTDSPISFYASTKKSNEIMAHSYTHLHNFSTIGLRFFTVYGPWGRPDMAMYKFTKNILESKPIQVYNNGELYRDFTFIEDIINGIVKIVESISKGHIVKSEIFNIGNSKPVLVLDFIKAIERSTGIKAIMDFHPMQEGDVFKTFASTEKLLAHFDYKPNISIEEGVEKFVIWYKDFYKIK